MQGGSLAQPSEPARTPGYWLVHFPFRYVWNIPTLLPGATSAGGLSDLNKQGRKVYTRLVSMLRPPGRYPKTTSFLVLSKCLVTERSFGVKRADASIDLVTGRHGGPATKRVVIRMLQQGFLLLSGNKLEDSRLQQQSVACGAAGVQMNLFGRIFRVFRSYANSIGKVLTLTSLS